MISVPLYVCATASVPIAAALVTGGLPLSAALVFLMAGPATNVATVGAVYKTLGKRCLVIYLFTIIGGSFLLGMSFESVLAGTAGDTSVSGHEHHSFIAQVLLTLYGLFGYFAWVGCRNGWRKRRVAPASDVMVVVVEGMTCGGCSGRLTKVLERAGGVRGGGLP